MDAGRERIPTLLRDFATSLAEASSDEESLLNAAAESCKQLLSAKQCSVWLLDSQRNSLVLRAATGYTNLTGASTGALAYPLVRSEGEPIGITAWIHLNGRPVSADSYRQLTQQPGYRGAFDEELHGVPQGGHRRSTRHPCQQFYGGPIYLGTERFGVLKVENKTESDLDGRPRFSEVEKAALDTVAAMLALAIKHARAGKEQQNRLIEYHAFTVHCIKNEIVPAEGAQQLLRALSKETSSEHDELDKALRLLGIGIQGLRFYLDHLLKFLSADIDSEKKEIRLWGIVQDEAWLLGEAASDDLEVKTCANGCGNALVLADSEFLSAAIKELLRNARKSVFRRREQQKREDKTPYTGRVVINLADHQADSAVPPRVLRITVSDDGEATVDSEKRNRLETAWATACEKTMVGVQAGQKGLIFLEWVVTRHGGTVELSPDKSLTTFHVDLPIANINDPGRESHG